MIGDVLRAGRELRALAGEVADVSLLHPAWLALVAGTSLLEALARRWPRPVAEDCYAAYLAANGGPRSDTFMARDMPADPEPAARVARAIARARAACAVLARLDGRFPGQPLRRALAPDGSWLRRVPLDGAPRAVLITPRGLFLADLSLPAASLARELAAVCAGAAPGPGLIPVDARSSAPTAASVAVDLSPQSDAIARHLHRRAWTAGGGPWLGVGETVGGLELATTCHLAVDGYGHGAVAGALFRELDEADDLDELRAAARSGLRGASLPAEPAPPPAGALPLGFAGLVIPASGLRFARAAYALGRVLARGQASPTFQIPVAPGRRDDPDRRRRRVLFGIVALRPGESYPDFDARLGPLLEREAAAAGLLSRVLAATATAPLPRRLKHSLLATKGAAHPLLPPIEVLAGRGQVSFIRYPEGERPAAPLYAVSAPGLSATARDAYGSFVVTLVDHGETVTVTVGGTGAAGTPAGARRLLDELLEALPTSSPSAARTG